MYVVLPTPTLDPWESPGGAITYRTGCGGLDTEPSLRHASPVALNSLRHVRQRMTTNRPLTRPACLDKSCSLEPHYWWY